MSYNYSKLKGKIIERFGNQLLFSFAMGWSERTCSLKLNNQVFWKQPEITKAAQLLGIDKNSIQIYFFDENVQND